MKISRFARTAALASSFLVAAWSTSASAQEASASEQDSGIAGRVRVTLGPKLVPAYPGASGHHLAPLINIARASGEDAFEFGAPDQSTGLPLIKTRHFQAGPAIALSGKRDASDVGAAVPTVGFTVELGGFAQVQLADALRLRVEARRGIGGHRAWLGSVGADYIARDGDKWLFSIGPRLTVADARYQRAYFGVTSATAAATGLRAYNPGGGIEAVGAAAGVLRQLTPRLGLYGYVKYDRLVRDAADSPLVAFSGSRNQLSGGIALSFVFVRHRH